ncbi:MAG: oligosaccharide flippase family protein [Planctomycetota bacterium]|jgi:O-antigen/teichoic acid export membrane protein
MAIIRSLIKNYCILLSGEAIARLLTLVTFAYLARALGPAGFGVIEFCFAHALILFFMVDFGVGVLGAREVAQRPDDVREITKRMVAIRFWSMALSVCLLVCYVLLSMPYLFQWVFLGRRWMLYVSISQIVRYGVFAGIVLLTVRSPSNMWNVAVAEFAGVLAGAIFTVVSFRFKLGFWPACLPVRPTWYVIKQVSPIALSHFMWAAKYIFVTVVVGFLAGLGENAEQVGHFGAAVRIIVAMHVFVSLYFNNLLPSVSRTVTESVEPLRSLLDRAVRTSAWVSLFGSVLLVLVAHHVVRFIYGEAFGGSVIILQILVWMLSAALVSAHFRVTLIAASRQGLELLSTTTGAVITLVLVVVLYRRFGLSSVAAAMVIGEMSTLVLSFIFVHRYVVSVRLGRCILPPVVATIVTAALLVAWPSMAVWAKASIVVVFFALAIAVLDPKFLEIFRRTTPATQHAEQ